MKKPTRLLAGIAAASLAASGLGLAAQAAPATDDDHDVQIIGGRVTDQEWPFMVRLADGVDCGGSLIAPRWVITAGHCVAEGVRQVRIGSHNASSGGEVIRVARIHRHPDFTGNVVYGNDLALLELDRASTKTPIPIAATAGAVGTRTKLLGWGTTSNNGYYPSEQLKELDVSIVADRRCDHSNIQRGMEICTDNPGGTSGACFGDSGGPQIKQVNGRWELIGATSRGRADRCTGAASIYSSLPAYMGWLRATSGNEIPAPGTDPSVEPTVQPTHVDPTAQPTHVDPTPGDNEFSDTTQHPFGARQPATSQIRSTFANAGQVHVKVDYSHQCDEAVQIAVTAPSGRSTIVKRGYPWFWRCTPVQGPFERDYSMSTQSDGTWTVQVTDLSRSREGGTLNSWSLSFS